MNPFPEDPLANLWERDGAAFAERHAILLDAVAKKVLPTAVAFGRDLFFREPVFGFENQQTVAIGRKTASSVTFLVI